MRGEAWNVAALFLFYYHVFTGAIPWLVIHWGHTWGVIAGAVLGLLASFVVLIPVHGRRTGAHRASP